MLRRPIRPNRMAASRADQDPRCAAQPAKDENLTKDRMHQADQHGKGSKPPRPQQVRKVRFALLARKAAVHPASFRNTSKNCGRQAVWPIVQIAKRKTQRLEPVRRQARQESEPRHKAVASRHRATATTGERGGAMTRAASESTETGADDVRVHQTRTK